MKIIKRGKLPEGKVYRITCDYCQTIVEVNEQEVRHDYIDEINLRSVFIECPVCENTATLEV